MKSDWLAEFRTQVSSSEKFYDEMDVQLRAQFERVTGETLDRFQLLPPLESRFEVVQHGDIHSVEGYLLDLDIMFPVKIAWTFEDDGNKIWWQDLPWEQIRDERAERRRIDLGAGFSFDVEIKNPVWPHLELTLCAGSGFDASRTEQAIRERAQALENAQQGGHVHRIGKLSKMNGGQYRIAIDFGTAGREFLVRMLNDLEHCQITRVTLDS
jgi:hypothetical protein